MASPVTLHIQPKVPIDIVPLWDSKGGIHFSSRGQSCAGSSKSKNSNNRKDIPYELRNVSQQGFVLQEEYANSPSSQEYEGRMSPLSDLSLPPKRKQQAGIPSNAIKYAYIYPPHGLAQAISWRDIDRIQKLKHSKSTLIFDTNSARSPRYRDNRISYFRDNRGESSSSLLSDGCCSKSDNQIDNRSKSHHGGGGGSSGGTFLRQNTAELDSKIQRHVRRNQYYMAAFAVNGAYVYFGPPKKDDKAHEYQVISVNVLCFESLEASSEIKMDGPIETEPDIVEELKLLDRFQVLPLEHYHECGYIAKAWVNPNEFHHRHGTHVA